MAPSSTMTWKYRTTAASSWARPWTTTLLAIRMTTTIWSIVTRSRGGMNILKSWWRMILSLVKSIKMGRVVRRIPRRTGRKERMPWTLKWEYHPQNQSSRQHRLKLRSHRKNELRKLLPRKKTNNQRSARRRSLKIRQTTWDQRPGNSSKTLNRLRKNWTERSKQRAVLAGTIVSGSKERHPKDKVPMRSKLS